MRIILPMVIAIVAHWLIRRQVRIPKHFESSRTKTYLAIAQSIVITIVYLVAIYLVFTQFNINVTPLFASAGVLGIVIGLGVRSFIEDFFTGLFILTEDTIRVGDYVEISGAQGVAETLGLRTVRIKDQNGAIHIFPNREIKKIVNYSRRSARVVIDIPIKANQKVDTAIHALTVAVKQLKKDKTLASTLSDGSYVRGVERVTGSSVMIRVLLITRAAFRWDVARKYRYLALKQLEKARVLLG